MADIVIRGMEMPTDGGYLDISIHSNGIVVAPEQVHIPGTPHKGPIRYHAVPLPDKHGRLGDLDKLEDAFIRYYLSQERSNHLVFTPVEIKQHFADMIGDWPTIVPAEGGLRDEQ